MASRERLRRLRVRQSAINRSLRSLRPPRRSPRSQTATTTTEHFEAAMAMKGVMLPSLPPVGRAFDLRLAHLQRQGTPLLDIAVELGRNPVDILIMFDAWEHDYQCSQAVFPARHRRAS